MNAKSSIQRMMLCGVMLFACACSTSSGATELPSSPTPTLLPTDAPVPPPTATPEPPPIPQGRVGHHLAYDKESQKVILFSGVTVEDCTGMKSDTLDDTWAWDIKTSSWTEMKPAIHPKGRYFGQMLYDSESDRVILFGGLDEAIKPMNDIWSYDYNSDTWEQLANGPGARWGNIMIYDSESDKVVLFGGVNQGGCLTQMPELFEDTWSFDYNTNTWIEMVSSEHSPARAGWQFAYSSKADRLFLFGGLNPGFSPRTWTYDLNNNAWAKVGTFTNIPDFRAAMVYDSESDRFIVFSWPMTNYIINYDLNTDFEDKIILPPDAAFPALRFNNSFVYIDDLDRVLMFGGIQNKEPNLPADIWLYDLNSNTWKEELPGD